MKAAIYPGTFDPPTLGHLNVIQRAASKFDRLVIAVGENSDKHSPSFSLEERVQFLKTITKDIPNIEIASFQGLLVRASA
ncbi:MAG: adenylyltransferase/cytidyltransferase family protein [Verrucomicrobia bacterium]|nr:adenylyltransferase/cytidyltransferase family protein [Verrucomicrobiota bacterium]